MIFMDIIYLGEYFRNYFFILVMVWVYVCMYVYTMYLYFSIYFALCALFYVYMGIDVICAKIID